jgi:hypothetical protein
MSGNPPIPNFGNEPPLASIIHESSDGLEVAII